MTLPEWLVVIAAGVGGATQVLTSLRKLVTESRSWLKDKKKKPLRQSSRKMQPTPPPEASFESTSASMQQSPPVDVPKKRDPWIWYDLIALFIQLLFYAAALSILWFYTTKTGEPLTTDVAAIIGLCVVFAVWGILRK